MPADVKQHPNLPRRRPGRIRTKPGPHRAQEQWSSTRAFLTAPVSFRVQIVAGACEP